MSSEHRHHRVVPGLICEKDLCKLREAVCVTVEKIYDSCKEKDCIEDAKVLFCGKDIQNILNNAVDVKFRCAEVVDVRSDIEHVPFKKGFYTIDIKYFIKVFLEFYVKDHKHGRLIAIPKEGIVTFDKKVILFGSEGGVKIFKSHFRECAEDDQVANRLEQDNLPISKVEVVEPIALGVKIENMFERTSSDDTSDREGIPERLLATLNMFEEHEHCSEEIQEVSRNSKCHNKKVVVSIGMFSILKLVRYVQLLIPAFDFCYPTKQCIASTDEDPCELFETIEFPFDEFFPPQKFDFPGALEQEKLMIAEFNRSDTSDTSETTSDTSSESTSESKSESKCTTEVRGHHHHRK